MKNISTLVKDIYSLFTEPDGVVVSKERAKELSDQAGKNIAQHIFNAVYEERKLKTNLRLSQIGKPMRQIWYSSKGIKAEEIDGPTYIKFLYGNILEELLIALSELSGHKVTEAQEELNVDGIKGHQDARVDGVLVDFKSASNFAFNKFNTNELSKRDPFGYIHQLTAYAKSKKDKIASWVIINKQTGEIAVSNLHEMEMPDVSKKITEVKDVVAKDNPPPRCYDDIPDGVSGNRRLDFGCVYCVYKLHCWSDANQGKGLRQFNYANGPRYFTKVTKVPNIEEINPYENF
tara:strand:+ start:863 stop:1732 length:870 start_codon:yes stop_codon:yes gene_type:complete